MASFLLPSSLALLFLIVAAGARQAALRPPAETNTMDLKDEVTFEVVDGLAKFAVDKVNQERESDYEKANGQKMPPKDNFLYQKPLSAEVETTEGDQMSIKLTVQVLTDANTAYSSIDAVLKGNNYSEVDLATWKKH
ncbi:hypothetical protein AXF42_Ash014957 [Apostasia shenzhenica]|uniref:Uncharacterized protein n=1 Tax=Apostasia shenzhenica TaxID=1088818 RepID=A0A2I0ALM2_9ASPA|nr:hypothetical protein AXF42_Ash014957 [Apostasia shenzhenica]